jgi:hypothetical protein
MARPLIIYGVNAIALLLIATYEYNSSSDKTIIISSMVFLILFVFNLMLGLFAQADRKSIYKHYYFASLALVLAVIVLLSMW